LAGLNRRILETIEKSNFDDNLKTFLKKLLMIELRNLGDSKPVYSQDYDREIINHLPADNEEGESNGN